jgi:hypothetical protein
MIAFFDELLRVKRPFGLAPVTKTQVKRIPLQWTSATRQQRNTCPGRDG